jgi:hypothetical protein
MAGRKPVNRKTAPRRSVVKIERVGAWGRVEYHHFLDCGHIEVRKRVAPTSLVSCAGCVLAETHQQELSETPVPPSDEDWDVMGSRLAELEKNVALVKMRVASRFGLPVDAVEVVMVDDEGELRLSGVVVLISREEVAAIWESFA